MWVEKGFFSHSILLWSTGTVSHHAEEFLGALPTHPGLPAQPRYGHYGPFCRSPYHVSECIRAGDPTPTPQTSPEPEGSQMATSHSLVHNTAFYTACYEKRKRYNNKIKIKIKM